MSQFPERHAWNVTPEEAIKIQQQLRSEVSLKDDFGTVTKVAGVDVGFEDEFATTRAAVVVLSYPELKVQEQALVRRPTTFPYVPGLLSFREIPALLEAIASLSTLPHLLIVDGNGYAHPRRLGIASHLGILSNIPSIGVAKSYFLGHHDPVPEERGKWSVLYDRGEVIGAVLRTKVKVKPVYVSSGHRISLEKALEFVMACTTTYRLPETTRLADKLASNKK